MSTYSTLELKEPVFGYVKVKGEWRQVKCTHFMEEPDGIVKHTVLFPDGTAITIDARKFRTTTPKKFVRHPEAPLNLYYENTNMEGMTHGTK